MPVLFLVHPRTRQRIKDFGLEDKAPGVRLLDPVGYLETVGLVERAALVVTDSGGLQVETTILGVPCLTARPNTEWTETIESGTNRLVAPTLEAITAAFAEVRREKRAAGRTAAARHSGTDTPPSGSSHSWSSGSLFPVPRSRYLCPRSRSTPSVGGIACPHRTPVTA